MAKVTVLGAGGWGLALALVLYENSHKVSVWTPFTEEAERLTVTRENQKLLSGIRIPDDITVATDITVAEGSEVTVIATPSFAVGQTAGRLAAVKNHGIVVNVAKGFEASSGRRLSEVIRDTLTDSDIAVLTGPSHAEEVARKIPTMLTVSGENVAALKRVQEIFSNEFLRVYTNPDIIGAELGGALKNIIAVAAGVCDGMGLGDNSRAALITRGLSEMTRLGLALGASQTTFAGLSGMGDLIVTCTSRHSRNHRFGELVGRGTAVANALDAVGTVEGYFACKTAYALAQRHSIDTPIITTCYQLLYEGQSVNDVVKNLMTRPFKQE